MSTPNLRRTLAVMAGLLLLVLAYPVSHAEQTRGATAKPDEAKFKAIFEPVNYSQDLNLTDVLFVTEEEGWVTGAAGTILHTSDGGATWEAQLGGDPQGTGRPVVDLRRAGDRTVFAAQATGGSGDHTLLRTTDGKTWTKSGTVGQSRGDYQFTSADNGVYVKGGEIHHTSNAGRTWQLVHTCALTIQVAGLTRKVGCFFESAHFPTSRVGYAISRLVEKTAFAMARTDDAGETWTMWTVDHPVAGEFVYFHDEQSGMARMRGGPLYVTADGGKSWTAVAGITVLGGRERSLEFADREVGWAFNMTQFHYTTDGGKAWISREVRLPAAPTAIALPSRRRGYAVGDHGMVYRYRVVPINYTVPNMVAVPMMP